MKRAVAEAPVPLLDLARVHGPLAEELAADFARVLASGQFILGAEHDAFERELAAACGTRHAIGLSSGTSAISLALLATGVTPGDEVIVPAFTYFATASAVTQIGARPVFVDVEPIRLGLDPIALDRAITPRTRAVVAVHLYGLACSLAPIRAIGEARRVPIVEDAAQAIGAVDAGAPVGTTTAGATLSFFPTKNLGALGDAGAFLTEHDDIAERVRLLRVHGDAGHYRHVALGTNARLEGLPIRLPAEPAEAPHTYHQFTIRAPRRDALQQFLAEHGIGSRIYYPITLPMQPAFADLGHGSGDFPISEALASEVLSLPIFPGLTGEEQDRVAGAIRDFYAELKGGGC